MSPCSCGERRRGWLPRWPAGRARVGGGTSVRPSSAGVRWPSRHQHPVISPADDEADHGDGGPIAFLLARRAGAGDPRGRSGRGAGSGGHLGAGAANRGRRSLGPQQPPPSSPRPQPTPPLRAASSPPLRSPEPGQLVPPSYGDGVPEL
ncbi:unnamed protein product [Urochloa humidicola]